MTRHGRNQNSACFNSYHERQKVSDGGNRYGSKQSRLNKDSLQNFDCCCLTQQPCKDPVVTPQGFLFDRLAILQYMVQKKKEYSKAMKQFEQQKRKLDDKDSEERDKQYQLKVAKFVKTEGTIKSDAPFKVKKETEPSASTSASSGEDVSNMSGEKAKMLPSFWHPSTQEDAEPTKLKKPDSKVYCPMSGKPLKREDLIEVKFSPVVDKDDKRSTIIKEARYMCAVTHDVLTNSIPCAVLRPSGSVVTIECVDKLIKPDMRDPINGATLKESDIIPLQRGGTGFAATGGDMLNAKLAAPAIHG